jgi:hypothetical protein
MSSVCRAALFLREGIVIPADFTCLRAKIQLFLVNARVLLFIPKASDTDAGPNPDLQSQLQSCQGKSLIRVPRLQTNK